MFEFSEYPKSHPLYSDKNKKVWGKFKDDLHGKAAYQFVGLKSKMYSIKSSKDEKKRAKEISARVVRSKLKHQDYMDYLQNRRITYEIQKINGQPSQSTFYHGAKEEMPHPFDDNRYLLDNAVSSLACPTGITKFRKCRRSVNVFKKM